MLKQFKENIKIYIAKSILKLENIDISDIQTKQLLDNATIDIELDDVKAQVVENLLNTFEYLKNKDLKKLKINQELYIKLNELLAYNQALYVGSFRDRENYINCVEDPIQIPNTDNIKSILNDLENIDKNSYKQVISKSFCNLAKIQPFMDGNKRSSLFICNLALLKKEFGVFAIPTEKYSTFEDYLRDFYQDKNTDIYDYMANEFIIPIKSKNNQNIELDTSDTAFKFNP